MTTNTAVQAFAGVTEVALPPGHRTYTGTTHTGTDRTGTERNASGSVHGFTSVAAAALSLGHRTYSGTVASTERLP